MKESIMLDRWIVEFKSNYHTVLSSTYSNDHQRQQRKANREIRATFLVRRLFRARFKLTYYWPPWCIWDACQVSESEMFPSWRSAPWNGIPWWGSLLWMFDVNRSRNCVGEYQSLSFAFGVTSLRGRAKFPPKLRFRHHLMQTSFISATSHDAIFLRIAGHYEIKILRVLPASLFRKKTNDDNNNK